MGKDPARDGPEALASILLPCSGRPGRLRRCARAPAARTRRPFDRGATDGTPADLAGAADAAPFPVRVIDHPGGQAPPAAIDRGLARSRGDRLVLLDETP